MGGAFSRAPSSQQVLPPCTYNELLSATLDNNVAALRELLPRASPEALAVTEPVSLYHAAAAVGSAEMVGLLAAAGVPIAAAQPVVQLSGSGWNWPRPNRGVPFSYLSFRHPFEGGASALAAAAALGHAAVVDALLDAGVSPEAGGSGLDAITSTAFCESCSPAQLTAVMHKMLAAGADVTRCRGGLDSLAIKHRQAARLLLSRVQQACEQGALALPHVQARLCDLAAAASVADDTAAFEYFVAQLSPAQAAGLATNFLVEAVHAGSLNMLALSAQAAATAPAQRTTAAAQLLGTAFEGAVPEVLEAAVRSNRPAVVELLQAAGYCATNTAVLQAVYGAKLEVLQALLCTGCPAVPSRPLREPLDLEDVGHVHYYGCPVLAAFERRAAPYQNSPQVLVHKMDAVQLPILEQLLAAGYRPTVYKDVQVRRAWAEGPILHATFDPLIGDKALDLGGKNRWLALALEHPAWSPAQHARFLPSFQAATRTLLLVVHRTSRTASSSSSLGSLLASLPLDLLLRIIGLATYPLSTWAALDACDG